MAFKLNPAAPEQTNALIDDSLNDASSHRRQWEALFDAVIKTSAEDDATRSYWEHEKAAFTKLMDTASSLKGNDHLNELSGDNVDPAPNTNISASISNLLWGDAEREQILKFMDDNDIGYVRLMADEAQMGVTYVLEGPPETMQADIEKIREFEATLLAQRPDADKTIDYDTKLAM